jgi:N-methylhydantoinase A
LTDANVVLGYIRDGELADGEVRIDADAARSAIQEQIAAPLSLSLLEAAEGIHRIANARTMRALRSVSTERGRDPRDFLLMAFGGSGPVHAAGLGRELGIRHIVVPPMPGLFSALGLLFSGVEHHAVRSCLLSGTALGAATIQPLRDELDAELLARFAAEGFDAAEVTLAASVDVRFQGQTSDIRIRLADGALSEAGVTEMEAAFLAEHERLYGHRSDPDNAREVTAVRVVGRAGVRGLPGALTSTRAPVDTGSEREAYFGPRDGAILTPVVSRQALTDAAEGPLLIDEYDSTVVVPPRVRARTDAHGSIVMEMKTES